MTVNIFIINIHFKLRMLFIMRVKVTVLYSTVRHDSNKSRVIFILQKYCIGRMSLSLFTY